MLPIDNEIQAYFSFYDEDEDDAISIANKECGYDSIIIKKEDAGVFCRACNEYNKYGEPDFIINDEKYTCWACAMHPERKRIGLTSNEVKKLNKKYKKC